MEYVAFAVGVVEDDVIVRVVLLLVVAEVVEDLDVVDEIGAPTATQ